MRSVRAFADRTHAIQRWDVQRRREIAVGSPAAGCLTERKPQFPGQSCGLPEHRHRTARTFHGRAIHATF